MNKLEWNESLSVGVEKFDRHHQHLIGIINRLEQVSEKRGSRREISEILRELMEYTRYHFSSEEEAMDTCGYEKADVHREKHRHFEQKVEDLVSRFASSHLDPGKDILPFLREWLYQHIMVEDRLYGKKLIHCQDS
jgi:hemerythrin-like metal-binding protein